MRKHGLGAVLAIPVACAAVSAQAGGYVVPVLEPVIAAPVAAPAADWRGLYAGLTLGYAFGADDRVGLSDGTVTPTGENLKLHGLNGGIHLGYRWQSDRWVFGPEVSLEGGNVKDSYDNATGNGETKLKNMAALRLKTGYLVNDQTLIYGIAGVAKAKFDYDVALDSPAWNLDENFSRTGYVVGLGIERKLTERISITGEYEYANFGKKTLTGDAGITTEATPKFSNVKIGVNFRF